MRAKFKIGTLVKHANGLGIVDAVVLKTTGVAYGLEGQELAVDEPLITAAYREIKPRAPKKTKPPAKRVSRTAAEAQA